MMILTEEGAMRLTKRYRVAGRRLNNWLDRAVFADSSTAFFVGIIVALVAMTLFAQWEMHR